MFSGTALVSCLSSQLLTVALRDSHAEKELGPLVHDCNNKPYYQARKRLRTTSRAWVLVATPFMPSKNVPSTARPKSSFYLGFPCFPCQPLWPNHFWPAAGPPTSSRRGTAKPSSGRMATRIWHAMNTVDYTTKNTKNWKKVKLLKIFFQVHFGLKSW